MKRVVVIEYFRFGKDFLKAAKRMGYETILAASKPFDEIKADDKEFIDYYVHINIADFDSTVNSIIEFYNKVPFDGVLPGHVFLMPQVAEITDRLGLPSFGAEAANAATYKHIGRDILKAEGLFPYAYYVIKSLEELEALKGKLNYPMIIKPVDGFSSINVQRVDNYEELAAAYKDHLSNIEYGSLGGKCFAQEVLIEEYINGKEYSVESIIENGEVHVITVTEKCLDTINKFIEIGHITPAPSLTQEQAYKAKSFVEKVHKALNIRTGVTHTEIKINGEEIGLIEVNPRVGGAYIPDIVERAFGVNMYEAVVRNCLGQSHLFKNPNTATAFIGFGLARKEGILESIEGMEEVRKLEDIEWVKNNFSVGSLIRSSKDNRARIVAYLGYTNNPSSKHITDRMQYINEMLDIKTQNPIITP